MDPYGRSSTVDGSRPDTDTGLEESMWRLGIGGGSGGGGGGRDFPYPERPGEPDCAYYMRTGTCGYGERCRYNHPRDRGGVVGGAVWPGTVQYPERIGQPVCEYYMKTGTCKFGSSCKFHHPKHGGLVQPVSLNYFGYPLRPGEKECSYYMRTGQCKFGSTCKFDHPQHASASAPSTAPLFYPSVQPPSTPSSQQYSQISGWQIGKPSSSLSGAYMPGPYGPVVISSGVVPVPGWSPYMRFIMMPIVKQPPLGQNVSPGSQQSAKTVTSVPTHTGSYLSISSSIGPSSSSRTECFFPVRPGQLECQYYMRTGDCKFGATCKYHHPPDWSLPKTNCILSPLGLPLRPGAQVCAYYAQHAACKFGPTCKFDHPMGSLTYSPSASSLVDMPVAPYPIGISPPTLAPSSSSTELRPDLLSNKDPFSSQKPSPKESSSGYVSPLLTKGLFLPDSFIESASHVAVSSSSSSSTKGHTGETSAQDGSLIINHLSDFSSKLMKLNRVLQVLGPSEDVLY
ncbi:Zinc finger CCCH domain-containing protein 6 [Apostasia shenzhenica]|uniref:Zinc finger CCCH domain-containing protein 6 n=1 Tax=Apostasia shenzhenica TaxID=1088818 RepID=A0A2I0A629_9ASPA|nr:Zinc finger CCCH domain-containing protein 6 [Apostasia shenzhenica]